MVVVFGKLELHIPDSQSLKEKRQIVQSILGRLRARTPVSAAEVDGQQSWSRAVLGIAAVASEVAGARKVMDDAVRLVESHGGAELVDVWTDFAS